MSLSTYVGSFSIDTTKTAGQDQAGITGVGFQPKALIFFWNGRTDSTDAVGSANINRGMGLAISSSNRRAIASFSEDVVTTSDTYHVQREDCCICSITATGTDDGRADLKTMDADGFTLTIDVQFGTALRVGFIALGGTDLTNYNIINVDITNQAAPVTQTVTGMGFQPDALFGIWGNQTSTGGSITGSSFMTVMMASRDPLAQAIWYGVAQDNAATSNTWSYCKSGEFFADFDDYDATNYSLAAITSFNSDGFVLQHSVVNTGWQPRIFVLGLKGPRFKVHNFATGTSNGSTVTESDVGFLPAAVLAFSNNKTESSSGVAVAHDEWSFGAFVSTSSRMAVATIDVDGLSAAEQTTTSIEFDEFYINISTSDTNEGLGDVTTINSSGFIVTMDDGDPSAAFVPYLAMGAMLGGSSSRSSSSSSSRSSSSSSSSSRSSSSSFSSSSKSSSSSSSSRSSSSSSSRSSSSSASSSSKSSSSSSSSKSSSSSSSMTPGWTWGEAAPVGHTAEEWTLWTFKESETTARNTGDYGKIQLYTGEEFVSPVEDTGSTVTKFLTITYDDYSSGSGSFSIEWRGSDTIFTQDADEVEGPVWEDYPAGGANKIWRYVQIKVTGL